MRKTLFVAFTLIAFSSLNAQSSKIGYIDYANIIFDLPDYKKMNDSLMIYYQELQADLQEIEDNYMKKQSELQRKIESGETNKKLLELEQYSLEQLQQLYQYTQEENQKKIAEKQEELLRPLREKVDGAIETVAKEKGFSMVLDSSVIHFKKDSDDVENLVRAKLKIISKEESEKKKKDGGNTQTLPINPMGN